jgi:hypothetical protein
LDLADTRPGRHDRHEVAEKRPAIGSSSTVVSNTIPNVVILAFRSFVNMTANNTVIAGIRFHPLAMQSIGTPDRRKIARGDHYKAGDLGDLPFARASIRSPGVWYVK